MFTFFQSTRINYKSWCILIFKIRKKLCLSGDESNGLRPFHTMQPLLLKHATCSNQNSLIELLFMNIGIQSLYKFHSVMEEEGMFYSWIFPRTLTSIYGIISERYYAKQQNHSYFSCCFAPNGLTRTTTPIRLTAVRETGVFWNHSGIIQDPPETPLNITALTY